jgi:hypothetical protein
MTESTRSDIDPIRELRLRRWARENYVPPDDRESSWHPIVLDEMRARDVELRGSSAVRHVPQYVPLEPSGFRRMHASHPPSTVPNLLRHPETVQAYIPG